MVVNFPTVAEARLGDLFFSVVKLNVPHNYLACKFLIFWTFPFY